MIKGLSEAQKDAYTYRANFVRRNLSPEQKDEALKDMKQIARRLIDEDGMTQAKTAAELGVARQTVTDWFSATSNAGDGNTSKPKDHRIKLDRDEIDEIMAQLAKGWSQAKVAAEHKISQQRVSQIKASRERERGRRASREEAKSIDLEPGDDQGVKAGDWRSSRSSSHSAIGPPTTCRSSSRSCSVLGGSAATSIFAVCLGRPTL